MPAPEPARRGGRAGSGAGDLPQHDVATHTEAVSLARTHRFSFYDSPIIASALEAGCDTLLTEDLQTGRRIEGLVIVNPFA